MLDYREIRPRGPLAGYVECFWTLAAAMPPTTPPERILPDGCVELILNCAAPFRRYYGRGVYEPQPLRMLVGQMDRWVQIQPTGAVDLIGIRFHPAGARAFFHAPMHEFTGHTASIAEVSRELDGDLRQALDAPAASRIARIETALAHRLGAASPPDRVVHAAVDELVRSNGCASVDALARAAGLSTRQLERRFLDSVGLSPKRLARILRFQRVFRAVSSEPAGENDGDRFPNWAAVAVDCGFYDQAHLIRDFHDFAGQTPAMLFQADAALTHCFTRTVRLSDFSNTPA